jgi:hypothetical protein
MFAASDKAPPGIRKRQTRSLLRRQYSVVKLRKQGQARFEQALANYRRINASAGILTGRSRQVEPAKIPSRFHTAPSLAVRKDFGVQICPSARQNLALSAISAGGKHYSTSEGVLCATLHEAQ